MEAGCLSDSSSCLGRPLLGALINNINQSLMSAQLDSAQQQPRRSGAPTRTQEAGSPPPAPEKRRLRQAEELSVVCSYCSLFVPHSHQSSRSPKRTETSCSSRLRLTNITATTGGIKTELFQRCTHCATATDCQLTLSQELGGGGGGLTFAGKIRWI